MKQIIIDCAEIGTIRQLHEALAWELHFPGWYGHNLDALHDCLTGLCEETQLTLLHFSALPFPTVGLLRVLRDSEAENSDLHIAVM